MAVYLQAAIKKAFLRCLWNNGQNSASTLLELLTAFQLSGFSALKTGRLIVNTSGGGYSTSFQVPEIGAQFKQEQIFALSEEFFGLYESAIYTLSQSDPPVTDPTDAQIYQTMMSSDSLQGYRTTMTDVTMIRYPTFGPVNP